jgi:hypothetical protein
MTRPPSGRATIRGLVVPGSHQVEELLHAVERLLVTVGDPSDDAAPRLVRMLRRCDSDDERVHDADVRAWPSGGVDVSFKRAGEAAGLEIELAHPIGVALVPPARIAVPTDRRQRPDERQVR